MSPGVNPAPSKVDWRVVVGVPIGAAFLRVLAATWRYEVRGERAWRERHDGRKGSALVLWHGQMLPLMYPLRNRGIRVLVSEHRDGEIIARLLQHFGYGLVRGSSTRGGARALVEMVNRMKAGDTVAVTPDGPKGPPKTFAPGVAVAAQRAGVPISSLFCTVDRAWHLKSWDAFTIPKPFARVVVYIGEPTAVRGSTPSDAEADVPRLTALIAAGV